MDEKKEEIVVEAGRLGRLYWQDLWRHRELILFLAWRDIAVRYKQTVLGVAWSAVRPLVSMVVFTVVFGKIASLPPDGGAPYAVMVFAALLPWQFFANALPMSANSIVGGANLISKVYFPRLIIPVAALGTGIVDLLVSLVVLGGMMAWYGFCPPLRALLLPLPLLLAILFTAGCGVLSSALCVKWRDVRVIVPFVAQIGLYVSPVGFSSSVVPERWRWLYDCNPMVAVIDWCRWCLIPGAPVPEFSTIATGVAVTALVLVFGVCRFRSIERSFADTI